MKNKNNVIDTTKINTWSQYQIDKLAAKTIIQAVKDFAFPKKISTVHAKIKRLQVSNPDYSDIVARLYLNERRKIIKDLRRPFMVLFSNGESSNIAKKLQVILEDKTGKELKKLQRKINSLTMEE